MEMEGTWTLGLSNFEFKNPENDENEEEIKKDDKIELSPTLEAAKKYIQTVNKKTGYNLYDHIAKILIYLLDHRPVKAADLVENISLEVSQRQHQLTEEELLQAKDNQVELASAEMNKKLFISAQEIEAGEEEAEGPGMNKNLIESSFYFQQLEVGLESSLCLRIVLSMKKLVSEKELVNARFWGKINGLEQDYYVVEADYTEAGEGEEDEEEEAEAQEEQSEEKEEGQGEDEESEDLLPKIKYKPPRPVPKEEPGEGANKNIYFVCNDPARIWTRLPSVTPLQIFVAKRIKKFFTGRLDAPIVSNPPFPGFEKNYLRAQLTRISAATTIAPAGLYELDESAEDDDGNIAAFVPAEDAPVPEIAALAELSGWVHTGQYVLPQGRCKWWNPAGDEEQQEQDQEAEMDFANPRKSKIVPIPPVPPPMLSLLSEDSCVYGNEPWSIHVTSPFIHQHAIVGVHSLLWPGAHAYALGKKYDNIYIGWGQKHHPLGYTPPTPFKLAKEYPEISEINEIEDPSAEEDQAALPAIDQQQQQQQQEQQQDDESDQQDDQQGAEPGSETE